MADYHVFRRDEMEFTPPSKGDQTRFDDARGGIMQTDAGSGQTLEQRLKPLRALDHRDVQDVYVRDEILDIGGERRASGESGGDGAHLAPS